MTSAVNICNMALSFIGDDADIASINPPDQSRQANLCAKFYSIARDGLLEMHDWNFVTKRQNLAQVTNTINQFEYAYSLPADFMKALVVMDYESDDDYSSRYYSEFWDYYYSENYSGVYTPQPYKIEVDADGNNVLYTNVENALLVYQARVEDTTRFSPLFITALAWYLASMLAGPIMKGKTGAAQAKVCLNAFMMFKEKAVNSDSNQRKIKLQHNVSWINGR